MTDNTAAFRLSSNGAEEPVLMGVDAKARLDGVLLDMVLRQTYRNAGQTNLEVVYTFPLAHGAVLLGFASELNGVRSEGVMVAKPDAEQRYEESLEKGDAPVMLEAGPDGLHTANIGNLKPGDELVLEVRYGQLLSFEQGRVRVAIPTTIAPRYGSPLEAGLQAQQVPVVSLEAEHRLALSLDVMEPLSRGVVECPTHRVTRTAIPGGIRLALDAGARLDRDVVLLVQPHEPLPALAMIAADKRSSVAPHVVMAALQPRRGRTRPRVAVKAVLDCSGSMGGDSIDSAKTALRGLLDGLTSADCFSLTRFGDHFEHVIAPVECTPSAVSLARRALSETNADLGGTRMEAALEAAFALPTPAGCGQADVLLLSDGEIWQSEETVAAARASGHRVFIIGVGASPAEGVLRAMAEATGGACEFATPGEAMEAAAARMLVRMCQEPWTSVAVDWGAQVQWQAPLPACAFGGDTVVAFAGFKSAPAGRIRLVARDAAGEPVEIGRVEANAPCEADALARIAASRRLADAPKAAALQLALDYQLIGDATNCILVHERADAERAVDPAQLRRVSSMLAAGWGSTGRLLGASPASFGVSTPIPCIMSVRMSRSLRAHVDACDWPGFDEPPNRWRAPDRVSDATLQEIAAAFRDHLSRGGEVDHLHTLLISLGVRPEVLRALSEVRDLGISDDHALLLLALWVTAREGISADDAGLRALEGVLASLSGELRTQGLAVLDNHLGAHDLTQWPRSRQDRLRDAMSEAARSPAD